MEEFNHYAELAKKLDEQIGQVVRKTALSIERGAKQRAPVKTGMLRNSIYTETETTGGMGWGAAGVRTNAIRKRHFNRTGTALEAIFPPLSPPGHNEAYVAVGVTYGQYVEYGTSRMGARPYMTPAVEQARPKFQAAMQRLLDKYAAATGDALTVDATVEDIT